MRGASKLTSMVVVILAAIGLMAYPAAANTKDTTVVHWNVTNVYRMCGFPVTFHGFGTFKVASYFDADGFRYKQIITAGGGGPLTVTATAKGTSLTMQNQSFQEVITFNPDGSVKTDSRHGIDQKFTVPGGGVVFLDVGKVTFDGEGRVVFEAGPHQELHGDFDAFCAAFE